MSAIPRPVSGQLVAYLAEDGNVYAVNQVDGRAYQLSGAGSAPAPPAGIPEAPADGNLYGRENSGWVQAIAANGDTLMGPNVAYLTNSPGDHSHDVELQSNGITMRNPSGWINIAVGTGNGPMITISPPGVLLYLYINASGDFIVQQAAGPNAGKSVNLTFGKWA